MEHRMTSIRILATTAVAFAAFAAPAAHAKCNVTVELTNKNPNTVTVLGDESKARVNGGTWSKMNFGNATIAAGKTKDVSWVTNMSCNGGAKRDLRIAYQQTGSNQTYEEMKNDIDVEPGVAVQVKLKH
jgi:hypothetical protein